MILHRTVIALGLAQLISWGTAYYLIGNFGTALAERNGWDSAIVYGGFSLALLVMGICSSTCGRLIDHYGGRPVPHPASACKLDPNFLGVFWKRGAVDFGGRP